MEAVSQNPVTRGFVRPPVGACTQNIGRLYSSIDDKRRSVGVNDSMPQRLSGAPDAREGIAKAAKRRERRSRGRCIEPPRCDVDLYDLSSFVSRLFERV